MPVCKSPHYNNSAEFLRWRTVRTCDRRADPDALTMTTAAPDESCLKRLGCTIHVTNRNYKDKTDNQQQIDFMEI